MRAIDRRLVEKTWEPGKLRVLAHQEQGEATRAMLNVPSYSNAKSLCLSHSKRNEASEGKRIAHLMGLYILSLAKIQIYYVSHEFFF